jgi:hypothetical protein
MKLIRLRGAKAVTEMMTNLDAMLAKLQALSLSENAPQQAVPKLLHAAKTLIETAEQITLNEKYNFDEEASIEALSNSGTLQLNRVRRHQEEHINPSFVHDISKNFYKIRRARDKVFREADIFADPAWDILLDLTIAERECRSVSVTSACIASCVPPTTGLRWVSLLETRGYVERTPDCLDGRRSYLRLTETARILMNRFYLELAKRRLL